MQRLLHVSSDGIRTHDVDPAELDDRREDGWIWLDVLDPTPDDISALARRFGLDRLTRDDLGEEVQWPKVDDVGDYLFVVAHALATDAAALRTVEVDMVLGTTYLVTVHAEPLPAIDHVWDRATVSRFALDGPDHLLARILEFSSRRYLPLLDELDRQIFDLEDTAVVGDPTVLPEIQALRRDVAVLRRVLGPQRSALLVLARDEAEAMGPRAEREISDVIDDHQRLIESLDAAHGMLATVLDTYRGAAAEKMNEVMKVLTVFSAIVLPLSLLAGVYGMNFQNMPELDEPNAYFVLLGAMAVLAVTLWLYFVRRGFIGGPRLRDLARQPTRQAGRLGRGLASVATLPIRAVGSTVTTVRAASSRDR